jgi:intracellular septation protein
MKKLIEFVPIIAFLAIYWTTDDFMLATKWLVISSAAALITLLILYKKVPMMTLVTLLLVIVFGGITLFLKDPFFVKIKVSIINIGFAGVFFVSHFVGDKKTIVQRIMGEKLMLSSDAWVKLSYIWIANFLFIALANLYVLLNYSEAVWVQFKLFGLLGISIVFVVVQGIYIYRETHKQKENVESE